MPDRGLATVVIAGGRRIDAADAQQVHFPLDAVPLVRSRVGTFFDTLASPKVLLVASAAAGADLLTLDEALRRGIRFRIVLPARPDAFRTASVDDRPGNWGTIFERVIAQVAGSADLVILNSLESTDDPYARATQRLVAEGTAAAGHDCSLIALVIWDGVPRGTKDYSAQLKRLAIAQGATVREILTRPSVGVSD
jgi:hypothetical protein